MIVRPGRESDILKVSRLWLQMVNELAPEYSTSCNVEWWRLQTQQLMSSGSYLLFVSEEGGKVLGFTDGILIPEPLTGKVHLSGRHFFVLPENRSGAVSQKLYRAIIMTARAFGAAHIDIICGDREKAFWVKKKYKQASVLVRR